MELFTAENPPITLNDIQEFETAKGLTLPEDYKAHMLQYNGATVESIEVHFGVPDDDINFSYFHPLKYGDSILVDTQHTFSQIDGRHRRFQNYKVHFRPQVMKP